MYSQKSHFDLLERGQKDDVLKKLATGSTSLNTALETGTSFQIHKSIQNLLTIGTLEINAAYSLPDHLVRQSLNLDKFSPRLSAESQLMAPSDPYHNF